MIRWDLEPVHRLLCVGVDVWSEVTGSAVGEVLEGF